MEIDSNIFLNAVKNIPCMDLDRAIENIGGSQQLYEHMLRMVIRTMPAKIADLDANIDKETLEDFAIYVHGMKGSLSQAGCAKLSKMAEELEKAAKREDREFCFGHYAEFKKESLRFYDLINSALNKAGVSNESENIPEGNISDFIYMISQAKDAATDFESSFAIKCLFPLTQYDFGEDCNVLIKKALDELEIFHPRNALPYIIKLLEACKKDEQKK